MPGALRSRLRRVLTGQEGEGGIAGKMKRSKKDDCTEPESDFYKPGEKMPPGGAGIAARNLTKLPHGTEICCGMTTVGGAFPLVEPGNGGFGFSTRPAHDLSGGND